MPHAPPFHLSAPSLMEEAARRAGHDQWGDLGFVRALELLLDSCRDAALTALGWRVLRSAVRRHLLNRLAVAAYIRAHPGATDAPLSAGVVVTGLPRTGSTVLHNLLALDPDNRVLRLWEALHPVPPDDDDARRDRVEQAQAWLERFYEAVPGFRTIHPLAPEGPEECDALLQNTFASHHFDDMFDAPAYSEWLNGADLSREYADYGLQLRVVGSKDTVTRSWVLKSPIHLRQLPAVFRTLPGALVVQCHRSPLESVASYASLIATLRRTYSERVSPATVGRQAVERSEIAVRRALAARDAAGSEAFVDVAHEEIVRDPVGVVRRVYDRAGRALPQGREAAMRRWVRDNPKGKAGDHRYSPADFGFTRQQVEEAFEPYIERFGELVSR